MVLSRKLPLKTGDWVFVSQTSGDGYLLKAVGIFCFSGSSPSSPCVAAETQHTEQATGNFADDGVGHRTFHHGFES